MRKRPSPRNAYFAPSLLMNSVIPNSLILFACINPVFAAEAVGLEEITVTGQKIAHSLQDTKESIAVITATTLEARSLLSLDDVLAQTAGVIAGTPRGGVFHIRGVSSGRTDTLRSELASLYVDGVALSGWGKTEGPRQMWDVQQVEVMRGPQSTNLGRNSLAGAVVVKTNDPVFENTAKLRLGAGNYGRKEIKAVANVLIKDDVSALRLSYEKTEADGFVNNITRNEDDIDFEEYETLRLKWLYHASDELRVTAALQSTDNDYGESTQAFEGEGFNRNDRIALADVRATHAVESLQASLSIDYQMTERWSLSSISSLMDAERIRRDDFDNLAFAGGVVVRNGNDENFSEELRFDFDGEQWRGSTGVYYSKIESNNRNGTTAILNLQNLINGFSAGLGNLLVGAGVYPALYDVKTGGDTTIEITNKAVFSEWEVDLSEQLRLSFGARYDQEDQQVAFVNTGSSTVVLPDPANFAFLGPAGQGAIGLINTQLIAISSNGAQFNPDTDYSAFLPHIGITYDINDDVAVSAFAKRGYRSGGTEITGLNTVNPYDAEYLDNYELALRSVLFDGRATFNANIYKSFWTDQQVSLPEIANSATFTIIRNAGESELSGIEAEFQFQVNSQLSTFLALGYSKTEFKVFVSGLNDFSGNEFAQAPRITAAAGAHYAAENGFFGGGNVTYQDEAFGDEANSFKLDARALVNVNAGYQGNAFKIEAYARNLFDKNYSTVQFQTLGRMGAPRELGARFTWSI